MFSTLKDFFSALNRLVAIINTMADHFDAANDKLAERLTDDDKPALVNGRRKTALNKE